MGRQQSCLKRVVFDKVIYCSQPGPNDLMQKERYATIPIRAKVPPKNASL